MIYKFVKPILSNTLKYHDSFGILYFVGIPALLGQVVNAIVIACMKDKYWQERDDKDDPGKPFQSDYIYPMTGYYNEDGEHKDDRKVGKQAGFDFLTEIVVMIIALVGGVLSGFLMKLDFFGKAEKEFSSQEFFEEVAQDEGGSGGSGGSSAPAGNQSANKGDASANVAAQSGEVEAKQGNDAPDAKSQEQLMVSKNTETQKLVMADKAADNPAGTQAANNQIGGAEV